jgi:hypothetical protein
MVTMSENSTQPTAASVADFVAAVENPRRREDAEIVLRMMRSASGVEPTMWGPTIIGFGSYHYRYETGREGDAAAIGFSPRAASLALYGLTIAPESEALLARLGKHRRGAACLYVNKLDDVDTDVLEELIAAGWEHMSTWSQHHG